MVYIEKKKIGKSYFYYHTRAIKVNDKIKKLRRYIGNDIEKANYKQEFLKSIDYFTDKEFELISEDNASDNLTYSKNIIRDIFKRNMLISNLREFDSNIDLKIENDFPVVFIYNSNSIEGSRIPLNEVSKILKGNKSNYKDKNEIKEVINSIECWNYVQNEFKFNIKSIKKLHELLTKDLFSPKGDFYTQGFKKINIVVGYDARPTTPPSTVKFELKNLFDWYNKNKKTMFAPQLAFEFYFRYELIHPFEDGNGRTGRLIMNKILKSKKYQPMIVFTENSQSHHKAFVRGERGNMKYFYDFMFKHYRKTFEEFYDKYL